MRRVLKWLLPALILAEVALVWFDVLDLRNAILIVVGLEALLLLVGSYQILGAVRRYWRDRASGLDFWAAFEGGLSVLLPRQVARLVTNEPQMFYCLIKWILRKTRLEEREFSYHKSSMLGALVLMVVIVTPVEALLVDVLLQAFVPLLWLRLLVLFLEAYAVLWLLGFYASRVALPYRLEERGLRLRHGVLVEGFVPYRVIRSVAAKKRPDSGTA